MPIIWLQILSTGHNDKVSSHNPSYSTPQTHQQDKITMKLQLNNNPYIGKSMKELAYIKATLIAEREVLADTVDDAAYYQTELKLVASAEVIAIGTGNFQ